MLPFKQESSLLSQDLGLSVPKMLALDLQASGFPASVKWGMMSSASPFFCNQGVSGYLDPQVTGMS